MQNAESIETLRERERERVYLEKYSSFCDAKKADNKLVIFIKNKIKMFKNKTDYLLALKQIKFLMLKGSLFFE